MKNIKKVIFLFMAFLSLGMFFACSDSGDDGDGETLVVKYSTLMTADNDGNYRVYVYNCVEAGENTYTVRSKEIHYFSSSTYEGKTATQLVNIVKNKTVNPSDSRTGTQSEDTTESSTNGTTGVKTTYNIPAGITVKKFLYS